MKFLSPSVSPDIAPTELQTQVGSPCHLAQRAAQTMKISMLGAWGLGADQLALALQSGPTSMKLLKLQLDASRQLEHAIASDPKTPNPALYEAALQRQKRFDLNLLAGFNASDAGLADASLRAVLIDNGIGFQVIYGTGQARVRNALKAIESWHSLRSLQPSTLVPTGLDKTLASASAILLPDAAAPSANWQWPCDKCSDPQCERQLFRRLVA